MCYAINNMNKYFIYYSYSGNGDFVASLLAKDGYQAIKIKPSSPFYKKNIFMMLKLGFDALKEKCREIQPLDLVIMPDDFVVVGTPTWNDRLATPVNEFLKNYKLNKTKTKFVLYSASGKAKHSVNKLLSQGFINKPLILKEPLKFKSECLEALKNTNFISINENK